MDWVLLMQDNNTIPVDSPSQLLGIYSHVPDVDSSRLHKQNIIESQKYKPYGISQKDIIKSDPNSEPQTSDFASRRGPGRPPQLKKQSPGSSDYRERYNIIFEKLWDDIPEDFKSKDPTMQSYSRGQRVIKLDKLRIIHHYVQTKEGKSSGKNVNVVCSK